MFNSNLKQSQSFFNMLHSTIDHLIESPRLSCLNAITHNKQNREFSISPLKKRKKKRVNHFLAVLTQQQLTVLNPEWLLTGEEEGKKNRGENNREINDRGSFVTSSSSLASCARWSVNENISRWFCLILSPSPLPHYQRTWSFPRLTALSARWDGGIGTGAVRAALQRLSWCLLRLRLQGAHQHGRLPIDR